MLAASDAKEVAANTKTTADNTEKVQSVVDNATASIQKNASGDWNITADKAKKDVDGNTLKAIFYLDDSGYLCRRDFK